MGDWTRKFSPGADVTYIAGTGGVTGGNVVYLSAAGTATFTAGASAIVLGVASCDAAAGARVSILRGGVQRVVASAAIAVGTPLKSAASGKVAAMTIGTDAQDQYLGFALSASSADGDVIDVQWVK